jgi:para-nitrobenzyl esterase
MVRTAEAAPIFAERFAGLLDASVSDGAAAVMSARPEELVTALDKLIARGGRDMPGAFPAGPTSGTELLPEDPVRAMRDGRAHRLPLIVDTNADEGKLFTRFLQLLQAGLCQTRR